MADNRPQPMQSPPLPELPGGAFSPEDESAEDQEGGDEEGAGQELVGEGPQSVEYSEEEEISAQPAISVNGLLYDAGTPGYEEALNAMQLQDMQMQAEMGAAETEAEEDAAEEEEKKNTTAETDPLQLKKDQMLEFVLLGIAGFKDGIDAILMGYDLYIIGALVGIAFVIWIKIVRNMQSTRRKNTLSNFLLGVFLVMECVPILAAVPTSLALYYIIFKIDKGYEVKRKMEKRV